VVVVVVIVVVAVLWLLSLLLLLLSLLLLLFCYLFGCGDECWSFLCHQRDVGTVFIVAVMLRCLVVCFLVYSRCWRARARMCVCVCVCVFGLLAVGAGDSINQVYRDNIDFYDTDTNTFTSAHMSSVRGLVSCGGLNGKFVVHGMVAFLFDSMQIVCFCSTILLQRWQSLFCFVWYRLLCLEVSGYFFFLFSLYILFYFILFFFSFDVVLVIVCCCLQLWMWSCYL